MSAGLSTKEVPGLVIDGIATAFRQWEDMSGGEWLQSAPEYLVTVAVADALRKGIPSSKRTVWLEHGVARALNDAGGVQLGRKPELLRVDGRIDIVLAHANQKPRTLVEIKSPVWQPNHRGCRSDLHRICRALLHGKDGTQLYSGVLGLYTSSAPPRRGPDVSAKARLERKWGKAWERELQTWEWADKHADRYRKHFNIKVTRSLWEVKIDGEKHAWAAVAVHLHRRASPRSS